MRGINKVTLMGNLTRDPELKTTNSGTSVARIGLATGRKWKDGNGEIQEETTFHTIVAWAKQAELAAQYLQKGAPVYIEGRISNREYTDKNGVNRRVTEVIASEIVFLPRGGQQSTETSKQEVEMDEVFEAV